MTNVTLSIDSETYERMKKYPEIRWSRFIRDAIKRRVEKLEALDKNSNQESVLNMLASEENLKNDWDNKEDERWNNV